MVAKNTDPLADELALGWGEDTIYCEATCDPEDILYEGSDDEDYDNPVSRKLRYEAAGQRFLDGQTPVLLTALLKGPFESTSTNWVNPWRSKHRTAGKARIIRTSPGKLKRSANVKRNVSIPETVQPVSDSLECHLPSPESLDHTSETETHPYLEEDELAKVREWRDAVDAEKKPKDKFWVSTPQGSVSERKRKAKGSSWLKHLANKRQRTDVMETGSIDTPIPSRNQPATSAKNAFNTSFSSVPDRLPSSAIATKRYFSASQVENPPSEAELSRDKTTLDRASAASTSPLSCLPYTPVLDSNANISSQASTAQQTPSKVPVLRRGSAPGTTGTGAQNGADNKTLRPAFETQEDESFCFKMRPRPNQGVEATSNEEASASMDEDTWSGLSSPNHEMASTIFDLQESISMEPEASLRDSGSVMEIDEIATSPLSSISSKKIAEFDISEEPQNRPDSASGPSLKDSISSISELTSISCSDSESDAMEVVPAEVPSESQKEKESEDEDMDEPVDATSSLTVNDHESSETDSVDGSSEEQEIKEDVKVEATEIVSRSATSNDRTPQTLAGRQEAGTPSKSTSSKPSNDNSTPSHAEYLLRASVKKRFIPQSSWEKLAKLTGSPSHHNLPKRRESLPSKLAPSPISVGQRTDRAKSVQLTPKTTTTPKATTPRRALSLTHPSSQNAVPTIVDAPAKQQPLEQEQSHQGSTKEAPIPFSQQTPWVANKLSQYATISLSQISTVSPMSEPKDTGSIFAATSPVEQSPWTDEMTELSTRPLNPTPIVGVKDRTGVDESRTMVVASQDDTPMQDTAVAATPIIRSTPEPQFSVKSFASFRSPSPEPGSRPRKRAVWRGSGSRMPSTQGILASATKNPWVVRSSERRVSFALLPHETKGYSSNPTTPCPSVSKGHQGSPPPDTPASELPTSEESKFHKHFDAVARGPIIRHKQRLLPLESQRTVGSPLPDAMAEAFLSADQLHQSTPPTGTAKSDRESDESQDPLDMAEDVFREMDHVFEWNLSGTEESPQKTQGQQSPW
ncbi:protamine p1 [Fusarium beomiforme]|uniref:Protamine p1 n=1 Tax=Fusarium beomiforme TaxID=44412 RepID=A0A9P5ATS7_9HYPO|nr:protamine p1 [Fusarium beomiforme]